MKKSIAFFITALFICSSVQAYFPSLTALAFDPEYTVFEPPMIYSVYEEEGAVIPPEHVILRSESDEGSREAKHVIPNPQNVIPDSEPGSQEAQQETQKPDQILNQVQDDNSNVIPSEHVILSDSEGSQTPVISTVAERNGEIPLNKFSHNKYIDLVGLTPYAEKAKEAALEYYDEIKDYKPPSKIELFLEKAKKYAKDHIDDIIYKATWKLPDSPDSITDEYIESLEDWQREKLHYGRNIYQTDIPLRVEDLDPDEWEKYGEAVAHNLAGASGNIDYRGIGKRAGQQAIYDKNGNLVVTPENIGTYDYYPPDGTVKSWVKHYNQDVKIWIKAGNSPDDNTNSKEREKAFKAGLKKYIKNQAKSYIKEVKNNTSDRFNSYKDSLKNYIF